MSFSIQWLGHSAFKLTTQKGTTLYIDPWFGGYPGFGLDQIDRADAVCLTHDHFDHKGIAGDICAKLGSTLVAQFEVAAAMQKEYTLQEEQLVFGMGMNVGGSVTIDDVTITMVEAVHSSDHGTATGLIFEIEGRRFYHAGDTSVFAGMEIIGELYRPDIVALPIGGVFTMDPRQAVKALQLLGTPIAIPIHYKTFPILTQDADEFGRMVAEAGLGTAVSALAPGEQMKA